MLFSQFNMLQVYLLQPSRAGARLLPFSVAISVGSLGSGFIMRRTGTYRTQLIISTLMLFFSLSVLASPLAHLGSLSEWVNVIRASSLLTIQAASPLTSHISCWSRIRGAPHWLARGFDPCCRAK